MRAAVVTSVLLLGAVPVAAQRGAVGGVRASTQYGDPAVLTVTGTNPCDAIRIDYGDGAVVTHRLARFPAAFEHAYARPGTYRITADGVGSCGGRVQATIRVVRGIDVAADREWRGDPAAQERFRGLDQNRDGIITRAEWRGNSQSFRQHDWNADGVLSGDEVADDAGRGEGRGEIVDRATLDDWTEERFRQLDRDRDGRLSPDEWRYDVEQYRRADWNADGRITLSEFLGERDPVAVDPRSGEALDEARFERLDTNDDGIVSRGEWLGMREAFERRDVNGDGVITRPEFEVRRRAGDSTGVVTVSGQTRWNPTGVFVRQGQLVRFDGDGTIQLSTNRRDTADARGSRTGRRARNAPLPDAPAGSLIARIGDSAPFLVGGEGAVRMPRDGEILLGVNDDYLEDNRGQLRVTVTVAR